MTKLSIEGRYLYENGKPFFWLGDTAWRLFHCLDLEQSRLYFKNRADKGFNVIQAVMTNQVTGRDTVVNGVPVKSKDMDAFISKDNGAYWAYVESVVSAAKDMGLYMALLPVWGTAAKDGFINETNAERYIKFLAQRFSAFDNIIWLLGGDIRGDNYFDVWDICGKTLKEHSPGKLVGFHPFGRTSSSYWFNDCQWLDFNMFQSGHRRHDQNNLSSWDEAAAQEPWHGEDSYLYVEADLNKKPLRPVLDGEPSYEHIPQGLHNPSEPYWEEHHVRRYAWWSVLAGACGHTYGDNSIMQFFGTGSPGAYGVKDTWEEGLHHAGSGHMGFLKSLMQEIGFTDGQPLQGLSDDMSVRVFGNDRYVIAYIYNGNGFVLKGDVSADGWWYDPSCGARSYFGRVNLAEGRNMRPPAKNIGHNDWALLLKVAMPEAAPWA